MTRSNKNFSPDPGKHITMYEGYAEGDEGDSRYFQGSEMLFHRIVAELEHRGYPPEHIDRLWAFGHDGALEREGKFPDTIDSLQLLPMSTLRRDVKEGGWTLFDEAWGEYGYTTQGQVIPTVTICYPEAFGRVVENDQESYVVEEPYRTGEAVVLEVELSTVFR